MPGRAAGAQAAAKAGRVVLWFRNDLRLDDHYAVREAQRRVQQGRAAEVLPVYCFDPREWRRTRWSPTKTGAARSQFLRESVADLRASLEAVGSGLLVYHARPEEVLPRLLHPSRPTAVLAHGHVASEELKVERAVQSAVRGGGGELELFWGQTLYHYDDLPFDQVADLPNVFTPFRNKIEKRASVRPLVPAPGPGQLGPLADDGAGDEDARRALPALGDLAEGLAALPPNPHGAAMEGGETAGLARLRYYLWDTDLVADYFNTRNGMLGGDYSTKLSPWLAHGCVSPRRVYWELDEYQRARTSNKSTYWVVFELLVRDFFVFFALKHGRKIFLRDGVAGKRWGGPGWDADPEALRRWKEGRTGFPLVDANMREMAATGFMSNRGRQNVASYLALDLNHDWRAGADHFESQLVDYDVCSNWGNWCQAAGLTGGRLNKFNVVKQSRDYDAAGDYLRTWLPELKNVPARWVHEPWRMPPAEQEASGCVVGRDYPAPLRGPFSSVGAREVTSAGAGPTCPPALSPSPPAGTRG